MYSGMLNSQCHNRLHFFLTDKDGEVLPEEIPPQKLIQLKTKDGQHITCSAVSPQANWMSYSDIDGLKLYRINMVSIHLLKHTVTCHKFFTFTKFHWKHCFGFFLNCKLWLFIEENKPIFHYQLQTCYILI